MFGPLKVVGITSTLEPSGTQVCDSTCPPDTTSTVPTSTVPTATVGATTAAVDTIRATPTTVKTTQIPTRPKTVAQPESTTAEAPTAEATSTEPTSTEKVTTEKVTTEKVATRPATIKQPETVEQPETIKQPETIEQPEVKTTEGTPATSGTTTGTTSSSHNGASTSVASVTEEFVEDYADCMVHLHKPTALARTGGDTAPGTCPTDQSLDSFYLNASVGFAKQICVSHPTAVSDRGNMTTLHMTIQPKCKINDNDRQKWIICSYFYDASSQLCDAREKMGLPAECCGYINHFISPPLPTSFELSCQEYYEGDCHTFYGYSGAAKGNADQIQTYALELQQCTGTAPPNPQCQRGLEGTNPHAAKEDVALFGTTGLTGVGLLLVALAMYMRRQRTLTLDRELLEKVQESTPLVHDDTAQTPSYGAASSTAVQTPRLSTRISGANIVTGPNPIYDDDEGDSDSDSANSDCIGRTSSASALSASLGSSVSTRSDAAAS